MNANARQDQVKPVKMLLHAWLVTALNPKSITFLWLSCRNSSARMPIS